MTIHFAAARPLSVAYVLRSLRGHTASPAANDNATGQLQNNLLRDALLHFARHGLGAAELAQREAERAFFAGDRDGYRHWLGICRALDQRMAAALAVRADRAPG